MRAVVLTGPSRLEAVELDPPECGPHEVLLSMSALGLGDLDVAAFRGRRPVGPVPWLLGRQGVGEIAEIGERVKRPYRLGQQVVVEPDYCCRDCRACAAWFSSACAERVSIGLDRPGLLAEFVAVPAHFTWPAPRAVPLEDLVCAEPLAESVAAARRAAVQPRQRALLLGADTRGLFLCLVLRARGLEVIVREPITERLDLACSLGALPWSDGDDEFDVVFDNSGKRAALADGLDGLLPGGTVVLLTGAAAPLDNSALLRRQLIVRGSRGYDHPTDFPATVDALASGEFAPGKLARRRYSLQQANRAFEEAAVNVAKPWLSYDW
ncbi:zinc-binding dehydrogenase [Amycolatopsis sp. 195334CR]|uniref:zinc-dependent alcohol dehydrogenase n=1 Tax=Amycolatopsis sp. 195334CR TaxID=2814588 RepID=UPI001A8F39ED|nr:alcohol dehydrogenase catalytic domain-containing protein [Amycolatopsis sp. 195334CR]MBN6034928.1 alcohol dehydrogenase catalytic domain-containing protein [Amycolatopsis sp. 195334CR]